MTNHQAPHFDKTAKTEFLKRTMARAVTPRSRERAHALRKLEELLARAVARRSLGVQGFLLSSIAKEYPVSKRAMELELRGFGPQGLVEAAEQIELRLWVAPHHIRK